MANATTTPNKTGRNGGDARGNNKDRAAQGRNLMRHWGDGTYAPCVYCGLRLTMNADGTGRRQADTLTRDRIIPGADGGRYVMTNLAPACFDCNDRRGDTPLDRFTDPATADRIRAIAGEYRRGGPVGPR